MALSCFQGHSNVLPGHIVVTARGGLASAGQCWPRLAGDVLVAGPCGRSRLPWQAAAGTGRPQRVPHSWVAGCRRAVRAAVGWGCAVGWPWWLLPVALAGRGRYWPPAASPSRMGAGGCWCSLRLAVAGQGLLWLVGESVVVDPGGRFWLPWQWTRPDLAGCSESCTREGWRCWCSYGASCGWPGMVVAGWGVAGGWPRWPLLAALAMDMAGPGWLHLAPPTKGSVLFVLALGCPAVATSQVDSPCSSWWDALDRLNRRCFISA